MPTVATGYSHWFYRDTGKQDGTPLLLLHGFTGGAEYWDAIIDGLHNDIRCLAVDLPGHGQTGTPPDVGHFTLPAVADSLAALLTEIGIDRVSLWGYSMGGRLALRFAVDHPARLERLILESASPGIVDREARRERRENDNRLAMRIEQVGVAAFIDEWLSNPLFATQSLLPQSKREKGRALRLKNSATGLAMSLRGMGTGRQEPLHGKLTTINVPTLVLAGEHDSKFRAIAEAMTRSIPRAIGRIVPGCGHALSWERPEKTLELVRPFLSEHAALDSPPIDA